MASPKRFTSSLLLNLTPAMHEKLRALAEDSGITVSSVIRQAISNHLSAEARNVARWGELDAFAKGELG